jgi:hypothetical protein
LGCPTRNLGLDLRIVLRCDQDRAALLVDRVGDAEVTTDMGTLTLEVPGIGRDQAPMDDTMAVFDGAAADTVVEVQGTDGLRALVYIDSAEAPERFDFPIGGDVASLRPTASGGVDALNGEGELIATTSAPWAVDANGADVPTRYEINGTTLTQVVEHRDGNHTYGIVADPCFTCFLSTAWQVAKCAAAITVAIAGVAVPLSKAVKIKRLVDEVGGVTKLAERIIKVAKGEGRSGDSWPATRRSRARAWPACSPSASPSPGGCGHKGREVTRARP